MLVVSGATGLMLSAGRFAFLPFQRKTQEKAMLVTPKTTGTSWSDNLSKDATFVMKSGDPSGFNLIDVMGWGALGHAVGFAALGVASFQ
jgi:photosystem I subunit V